MRHFKLAFDKLVANGNDFLFFDDTELQEEPDWSRVAERFSVRKHSVGSDGIIVYRTLTDGTVGYRMFNPDGSEDFCGNGLICLAVLANQQRNGLPKLPFTVQTKAGERVIGVSDINSDAYYTTMGQAIFDHSKIPFNPWYYRDKGEDTKVTETNHRYRIDYRSCWLEFIAVSTGTPNIVVQKCGPDFSDTLFKYCEHFEKDRMFPNRTAIMWPKFIRGGYNDEIVELRIWERGAGETDACGTGSCAVAATIKLERPNIRWCEVRTKGGMAVVETDDDFNQVLHAPADYVCSGEVFYEGRP